MKKRPQKLINSKCEAQNGIDNQWLKKIYSLQIMLAWSFLIIGSFLVQPKAYAADNPAGWIRPYHINRCIDVHGWSTASGFGIHDIWDCVNQNNEYWLLQKDSNIYVGYYKIQNRFNGLCVGAYFGQVAQEFCDKTDDPSLYWRLEPSPHRYYYLYRNIVTNTCLSVNRGLTGNGTPLIMAECVKTKPHQQWRWNRKV